MAAAGGAVLSLEFGLEHAKSGRHGQQRDRGACQTEKFRHRPFTPGTAGREGHAVP